MKLEQLMEGVPFTLVQGSLDTEIADIIYDSRKAAPGLLFVCIVGTQRDSHAFAADCAAKGVSALVIQHDIDLSAMPGVTVVKVENSRYAMALMSANLFGNPARQMTMIGVTGTKGKTTTTHMIKSVLEAAGRKVGMIGTNGIYYMGRHKDTANTTPESYELQKTFREFLDAGCDTALMEVSSQGLMMDRVAGVHYDVGVFTNLSPDHIGPGEHKTFEEYRSWKGQLFKRCDVGVVNIDDENTAALLEGHTCKLVTYGRDEKADYRETGYELLRTHDFLGVAFHVTGKDEMNVKVNMPGEFSVYNALAALAVGKVLGLPDAAIHDGLGKCVVKGRVELVPISKKFTILLDYAHNEVSTESLLTTCAPTSPTVWWWCSAAAAIAPSCAAMAWARSAPRWRISPSSPRTTTALKRWRTSSRISRGHEQGQPGRKVRGDPRPSGRFALRSGSRTGGRFDRRHRQGARDLPRPRGRQDPLP